jgi:hypothetical protein
MNNHSIPPQVAQLAATLLQPQPLRRGSLYERRMKCGQASCPCQNDPKAAHGPYFTLTQKVDGKTRSRYVASDQAGLVQRQIAAGRQFREQVDSYWEACEQWADQQLQPTVASQEATEKKGSKRISKKNSAMRSKRS